VSNYRILRPALSGVKACLIEAPDNVPILTPPTDNSKRSLHL